MTAQAITLYPGALDPPVANQGQATVVWASNFVGLCAMPLGAWNSGRTCSSPSAFGSIGRLVRAEWARSGLRRIPSRASLALKILKSPSPKQRKRFIREARAASAVEHPNVVRVEDVFELDDGTPLMVLELLTGETLGQRLGRDKRFDVNELAAILLPVVSAVGTAHAAGIVHRDLKPANIFLSGGDAQVWAARRSKVTAQPTHTHTHTSRAESPRTLCLVCHPFSADAATSFAPEPLSRVERHSPPQPGATPPAQRRRRLIRSTR